MTFCTKCGQSVKDTVNFCGFCGQALGGEPPRLSNQALEPGELFAPKPNAAPASPPSPRGKLLLFTLLFAAAGLALIFLVAPELTDKWTWLWNTWEETTPEYWMAMVGGGVCLLLSGAFLLKALTLPGEMS